MIDRSRVIEYVPYQKLDAETVRSYGLNALELQGGMHFVERDRIVVRGVVAIAKACKLLAPITVLCELFNTSLAQWLYEFIAGRRYRLFGCSRSCYVPGDHLL